MSYGGHVSPQSFIRKFEATNTVIPSFDLDNNP
jgi:hypothetical protein